MLLNKIKNEGGFTLNGKLEPVQSGYVCAFKGHEKIFNLNEMTEQDVQTYLSDKHEILEKNYKACFGAWLDTDTNKVYLDLSEVSRKKNKAIRKGIKRKQLAIFDLNTFESIYMKDVL